MQHKREHRTRDVVTLPLTQQRQDVYPVYALIAANQAELPVRAMCKTLKVSASGFYGWLERPICQRQQANVALTAQIGV